MNGPLALHFLRAAVRSANLRVVSRVMKRDGDSVPAIALSARLSDRDVVALALPQPRVASTDPSPVGLILLVATAGAVAVAAIKLVERSIRGSP